MLVEESLYPLGTQAGTITQPCLWEKSKAIRHSKFQWVTCLLELRKRMVAHCLLIYLWCMETAQLQRGMAGMPSPQAGRACSAIQTYSSLCLIGRQR